MKKVILLIGLLVLVVVLSGCVQRDTTETADYVCSYNAYDCKDFQTQAEAQSVFVACGGLNNDVHWLDGDNDGIACETLP